MSIVINTPSGHIGHVLAKILLDVGQKVTIISRNPDKVQSLTSRGARLVQGSIDDENTLRQAFAGQKAVFWVTPPPVRPDFAEWNGATARMAAEIARAAGVERAVMLSSLLADSGPGAGPISTLFDVEMAFNRRIPHAVALRAGYFMENFLHDIPGILSGTVYSGVNPDRAFPIVATRDIAYKAASFLLSQDWVGHKVVGVHGPVHMNLRDCYAQIAEGLGRPVNLVSVPVEGVRAAMLGMGMPEFMVTGYCDMFSAFNSDRPDFAEPRTAETTTHTTLRSFVRKILAPAVESAAAQKAQS
ncbi:MAG TPA: NAD(P)H-binding protein [Pseudomonadota bacterium]|jgi:uncharacterized protein YbjT (DUF2867 family)|nr:NAD(P)H-binding protein [Pseudomonadota bacterium]